MTYWALLAGYAAGLLVLTLPLRALGSLWPREAEREPGWPIRRVAMLLVGIIIVGQMFQAGWLIPSTAGRVFARMANQALIFSPVFIAAIVAASRGPAYLRRVALIPSDRVWQRLAVGITAAALAFLVHQGVARGWADFGASLRQVTSPELLSHAVQILGEDIAIAMLLAAIVTRVRPRVAIVATGLLFALGHVPTMLVAGTTAAELARLVADGLLAAAVVAALLRMRDVWAIWPMHVAMDLTQFLRLP